VQVRRLCSNGCSNPGSTCCSSVRQRHGTQATFEFAMRLGASQCAGPDGFPLLHDRAWQCLLGAASRTARRRFTRQTGGQLKSIAGAASTDDAARAINGQRSPSPTRLVALPVATTAVVLDGIGCRLATAPSPGVVALISSTHGQLVQVRHNTIARTRAGASRAPGHGRDRAPRGRWCRGEPRWAGSGCAGWPPRKMAASRSGCTSRRPRPGRVSSRCRGPGWLRTRGRGSRRRSRCARWRAWRARPAFRARAPRTRASVAAPRVHHRPSGSPPTARAPHAGHRPGGRRPSTSSSRSPSPAGRVARRNIPVVDGRIIEIAHHGGHIATVNLDTGRNVAVDILFAHPRNKPSASLHESLGLATVDTPLGIALKVDERRETSMPGIYAAGDLANPLMPSVTLASSHGATAGISAQQSMLV
jgi:Pyridine nucleotide-disulphide oxidoreductase